MSYALKRIGVPSFQGAVRPFGRRLGAGGCDCDICSCGPINPCCGWSRSTSAFTMQRALSDDEISAVETDSFVLRRVDQGVAELVKAQKAEETRRKITLILTGAGVLFAAVKLGFVAIPHIRSWRETK